MIQDWWQRGKWLRDSTVGIWACMDLAAMLCIMGYELRCVLESKVEAFLVG
jgi:hypothetical protein